MMDPEPHPFGQDIWTVAGRTTQVAGFAYPTRMIVVRLTGGALFIWSPVALSTELRDAVDLLGPVDHVVAPNALHHRFLGEWRLAYSAARFHAPPRLRAKRPDILFDGDLDDVPAPEWSNDLDQVIFRGNRITTEVVFFHRASRTVIFADLFQHFERGWFTGWRALAAKLDLLTAPEPAVPRKFRLAFTDRRAARRSLEIVMRWPAERLLAAHAAPVEQNGRAAVSRAFEWLSR